jgi:hypothetical protein
VIDAYARSISEIWLVMTPIIGASFIMGALSNILFRLFFDSDAHPVLFLRQYSLKRTVIRGGDQEKAKESADMEKGAVDEDLKVAPTTEPAVGENDDAKTIGEIYSMEKRTTSNSTPHSRNPTPERPTTSSTMKEKEPAV